MVDRLEIATRVLVELVRYDLHDADAQTLHDESGSWREWAACAAVNIAQALIDEHESQHREYGG